MRRSVGIASLGVLVACTAGCGRVLALVGKPRVVDVRPKIRGIDFDGVNLAFEIDLANPYPFALRAPIFRYGLDIEGAPFLKGEEMVHLDVPPHGVGTIVVPTSVAYGDLWRAAQRLRKAKVFAYRLHGDLLVAGTGRQWTLPVAKRGTVPIFRPPRFSMPRVRHTPTSWSGAQVTLETDVTNPNAFPIGVHDVRYALTLGDVAVGAVRATTGGSIAPDGVGPLTLAGQVSATRALLALARGAGLGKPRLVLTGSIETPYGTVDLTRKPIIWEPAP